MSEHIVVGDDDHVRFDSKARRVYDVTLNTHPSMLVWPGDPPVRIDTVKSIALGASSDVSLLQLSSHTGTHVDAPCHFILGAPGIDSISLEVLLGHARLFQLLEARRIDRRLLTGLDLTNVTRLLLGTRNSALLMQRQFESDYVFVSEDATRYLVDIGIKLVGVDYLSIEEYHKQGHPTHHILLEAGVVIVEELDLSGVPGGDYELICLPLKLRGVDGRPTKANDR